MIVFKWVTTHRLCNVCMLRYLCLVSLCFTRVNADAISNMSTIVKKELVQSHDRYVELTREVMWLNLTLFNQSTLFTVIRELVCIDTADPSGR